MTADDVAAASAAYLDTILYDLLTLPPKERFERLALHFRANLEAFQEAQARRIPVPSDN